MQAILSVTVPVLRARPCRLLGQPAPTCCPKSAIPGLNAFVLYFALPCLLFRFGAGTPIFDLLNPAVLGVWLLGAVLMVFVTIAVTLEGAGQAQGRSLRRAGGGVPEHRFHGRADAGGAGRSAGGGGR